ncbi:endonuclease/exonuclease/phosphatase family protein [Homoserinibacter sp. YIM 151385]|uniref:endonuclease/exonuclease/phosphatase family protein n=1 Tax=Homoserinibacter sp. YIM 151385 TaxID=2985506 RepID=UPI0022F13B48|nr:endonuclease/exonuclease/phosphatase family protein [Homoserinibacter sp. YIM 151385]WBU38968.1 endonuclease/exonuclease/phosphatase family protein [Homoserinibacter sp. YIM 151385]
MIIGSYNLWNNQAAHELESLVAEHSIDMLCLQEADTTKLPAVIGDLHRGASTERNRLGLAVYYREPAFDSLDTAVWSLPKSIHDYVMSPGDERLLAIRVLDRETEEEVVVASFHAAPLSTVNSVRRRQIKAAHTFLAEWAPGVPMIMVGDYNYPLFRGGLLKHMDASGHEVRFSDSHTYKRYRYIKGHFDFVTSMSMMIESVATLPKGASDHHPVLVHARPAGELVEVPAEA